MSKFFVGLDSGVHFGVAVCSEDAALIASTVCHFERPTSRKPIEFYDNMHKLAHQVYRFIESHVEEKGDLILCVESSIIGRNGNTEGLHALDMRAIVVHECVQKWGSHRVDLKIVHPSSLKKDIAGSGRASKAQMKAVMHSRYPQLLRGSDHEIDAAALAFYAQQHKG